MRRSRKLALVLIELGEADEIENEGGQVIVAGIQTDSENCPPAREKIAERKSLRISGWLDLLRRVGA